MLRTDCILSEVCPANVFMHKHLILCCNVQIRDLAEGEQCLAKYEDGIWYKATIRFEFICCISCVYV